MSFYYTLPNPFHHSSVWECLFFPCGVITSVYCQTSVLAVSLEFHVFQNLEVFSSSLSWRFGLIFSSYLLLFYVICFWKSVSSLGCLFYLFTWRYFSFSHCHIFWMNGKNLLPDWRLCVCQSPRSQSLCQFRHHICIQDRKKGRRLVPAPLAPFEEERKGFWRTTCLL